MRIVPKTNPHYWRNLLRFTLICVLLGIAFFFYVGYPYFLTYGHTHPQRATVCCLTPADLDMPYTDLNLTTRDGITIRGWYIPGRNGAAVILLHPIGANRKGMLPLATLLNRAGYAAVLIDLRRHGDSGGEVLPYGGPETEDVRAAVDFLLAQPEIHPSRIGVMGLSLGAQVAILSAARIPEISAVVADGPGAVDLEDWPPPQSLVEWAFVPFDRVYYWMLPYRTGVKDPLSIVDALPRISPRPLLLISADTSYERRRLSYFITRAGQPSELWLIQGTGHLGGYKKQPAEYERKVIEFFDSGLMAQK